MTKCQARFLSFRHPKRFLDCDTKVKPPSGSASPSEAVGCVYWGRSHKASIHQSSAAQGYSVAWYRDEQCIWRGSAPNHLALEKSIAERFLSRASQLPANDGINPDPNTETPCREALARWKLPRAAQWQDVSRAVAKGRFHAKPGYLLQTSRTALSAHHLPKASQSALHYKSLQVTTSHYKSLQVTTSHYKSLQVTTSHYKSLQVTTSHYKAAGKSWAQDKRKLDRTSAILIGKSHFLDGNNSSGLFAPITTSNTSCRPQVRLVSLFTTKAKQNFACIGRLCRKILLRSYPASGTCLVELPGQFVRSGWTCMDVWIKIYKNKMRIDKRQRLMDNQRWSKHKALCPDHQRKCKLGIPPWLGV